MSMTHGSSDVADVADRMAEEVENGTQAVEDTVENGMARALSIVEDAASWTGSKVSAIGDRLQQRPLQTAAMALVAGAAFGWFMRRR